MALGPLWVHLVVAPKSLKERFMKEMLIWGAWGLLISMILDINPIDDLGKFFMLWASTCAMCLWYEHGKIKNK
jgi:hypothetical protein